MSGLLEVDPNSSRSPSRSPVKSNDGETPDVIKGKLDLSKKGYGKLSLRHKNAYGDVKFLDISHNTFKYVNGLNLFSHCIEVRASYNCLERLSSFLPLRDVLRVLDVSNNMIANCEHLASLASLVSFCASHNRITELPLLNRLCHLTCLDLSANRLESVPKLFEISTLRELNLNGNRISTLENISQLLPLDIKCLDIGDNSIADLRQAEHLSYLRSLDSLAWCLNPCVRSESRTFTYRPFLYSCCFGCLRVVDDVELREAEIIKGEQLCTVNKTRRAQTHAELCAILAKECPIDVDFSDVSSLSSFDDRLIKVMEKRREYMSTTTDGEETTSVSFADSLRKGTIGTPSLELPTSGFQLRMKDSEVEPVAMASGSYAPVDSGVPQTPPSRHNSPPPSASSVTSTSTFVLSHQDSLTESVSVAQIKTQAITKKSSPRGPVAGRRSTLRTNQKSLGRNCSRATLVTPLRHNCSAGRRPMRPLIGAENATATKTNSKEAAKLTETPRNARPKPIRDRITASHSARFTMNRVKVPKPRIYTESQVLAAICIQAWWRAMRIRQKWRVPLIEARLKRFAIEQRKKDERVRTLEAHCDQLSKILEQQSKWMRELNDFVLNASEKMQSRLAEYNESLRRCLPVPSRLEFFRVSPTDINIQWQDVVLPQKSYVLYVDGRECGTIRAEMKKARIQDLDPQKESIVEMRCICGDVEGDKSTPLVVPPYHQVAHNGRKLTVVERFVSKSNREESNLNESVERNEEQHREEVVPPEDGSS
uniref:Centrosomal protein of 97 kDa n=1 Tax=Ascaris suum TaxID=6253 RepID=F1KT54_ASCSU